LVQAEPQAILVDQSEETHHFQTSKAQAVAIAEFQLKHHRAAVDTAQTGAVRQDLEIRQQRFHRRDITEAKTILLELLPIEASRVVAVVVQGKRQRLLMRQLAAA